MKEYRFYFSLTYRSGPDPFHSSLAKSGRTKTGYAILLHRVQYYGGTWPGFSPVLGIRIRIQWGPWILIQIRNLDPDPDPGGQKWHTKKKKLIYFICSLLRPEGFPCKFHFWKIIYIFCQLYFFSILASRSWIRIRIRIRSNAGSGSASRSEFNESGSATPVLYILQYSIPRWTCLSRDSNPRQPAPPLGTLPKTYLDSINLSNLYLRAGDVCSAGVPVGAGRQPRLRHNKLD